MHIIPSIKAQHPATAATQQAYGSEGHIKIDWPWLPHEKAHRFELLRKGADKPEYFEPATDKGVYSIQVDTVAANIEARQAPAPCMRWDDTIGNMKTLDMWRESVGLKWDSES